VKHLKSVLEAQSVANYALLDSKRHAQPRHCKVNYKDKGVPGAALSTNEAPGVTGRRQKNGSPT
jgi:hypothetical protein